MEEQGAAKIRRLEDHQCLSDALEFSPFPLEDLPEEIQHLVLSLQSLKEAARTSIVSRKWREVWTRCPNLCFDGTEDGPTDEDCVKIKEAKFIETVNSVIQKHTGTRLNKFSIRCYLEKNCSDHLDRHDGIFQMAQFVDLAPRLETLELHMCYSVEIGGRCWCGESEVFPMRRLDHLKTVYMSGFRCYRPQIELLHGILENGDVLEHVTIEPMVKLDKSPDDTMNIGIPEDRICDWARLASERFGKDIVVVKAPRRRICKWVGGWSI